MNQRALSILEYDKIISRLETFASSPMGKKKCAALLPSADYEEILHAQEETRDALSRVYKNGPLSFQGLADIRPHLRLLEIESALTAGELLDIARLLAVTAQVKEYGETEDEDISFDSLHPYFDMLEPLEFLHRRITSCILSADEISDDASAALRDIRKEIKQTNIAIHNKLASIINAQNNRTVLQDALITMRNGRYCVPVKAEYKNSFKGMIHDQSASGSTLFIEPMAVVQLNNKIKELDIQEQVEIEKILQQLSSQAAGCTRDLQENQDILTKLDFIFAKAKFAKSYQGSEPLFNTDGILDIKQARHPLLDPTKVVPVHIYIGEEFQMLLLTGPNTGGKTVSLKTAGLFQLMGQAGLHIPAFEGSRLAVFSDIFADIGDEQSIEMNLSTFSSHMTNIIGILKEAQPDSLVLLDELCGGTDPTEGAALAISILDDLHTAGIRTIATTHYSELKMYAMETDGVENGCCEFDLETLSPTYRLLIGIPGKSNAFAISRRLGLPEYIIDQAHSQIDATAIDFETMLSELEKNKAEIEREQAELYQTRQEIESLKNQLKERQDDIKEKRAELLRQAREEAHNILTEAKEVADASIKKYNAWAKHPGQDNTKKMEAQRSNLRGRMSKLEKQLAYKTKKAKNVRSPEDFKVGDAVFVTTLSLKGTVQSAANKNGDLVIQMGFLSSTVNYKNLELLDKEKEKPQDKPKDRYSINKAATISPEINLLGHTVDEAVAKLEKYLDDAMIAGLSSVRVVHGKGTGALRKGIHEYLRRQKFVKSYQLAEFGEGDAGVTVVTFR
ncbi:MAG: endonuclease MutS2 [Eubacteriales bacterium]|nr:endonuclease MutS2 [Eubacteriales bacterium]